MDSLTHALVVAIALSLAGRPDLIPYGIVGAVLPDVDVLFTRLSDRRPSLYIFTHGGFTHSFFGALAVAIMAAILMYVVSNIAPIAPFGIGALAAIAAGALSHLTLDYLAYPGIPLFYPISDKKHTLGILGGPSAFIMLASVVYVAALSLGRAQISNPWPYVTFFALVLALCAVARAWMASRTQGRAIATMNPFRWAVIEDTPDAYLFYHCDLLGRRSTPEQYPKHTGITPEEARKSDAAPEIRRLRYHSYAVTIETDQGHITYHDPIREKGHIWYPPYYKTYSIPRQTSGREKPVKN